MVISVDTENPLDKIQHGFMIIAPVTVRPRTIYLNRIKAAYAKAIASIIINGKPQSSPIEIGKETELARTPTPLEYTAQSTH